jgi:hypothetical protein
LGRLSRGAAPGLCHACYGTDGFAGALLKVPERPRLVDVIGVEAEALVYLYGSCDRAHVYPQLDHALVEFKDRFTGVSTKPHQESLRAFAEITAANELDVVHNNPVIAAEHGAALQSLFLRARSLLSPAALEAWTGSTASQLI